MGKVSVTVHELSNTNMTVRAGDETVTLSPTQTREFDGNSITITEEDTGTDNRELTTGGDVFQHNNPNGITRAEISAKLPKAAGELVQETTEDGRTLERVLADGTGIATAAGGIEGAEEGKTPGPKVNTLGTPLASGAAATGSQSGDASDPSKPAVDPKDSKTSGTSGTAKAAPAAPPKK